MKKQITVCDRCGMGIDPSETHTLESKTPAGSLLRHWDYCPVCYDQVEEFLLERAPRTLPNLRISHASE